MSTRSLRVTRLVQASCPELWEACATPEGLQGWQADVVQGIVQPGGRLLLSWPRLGIALQLSVAEVVLHKRIVFQSAMWQTTLEVNDGRVTLTQSGSMTQDELEGTESGWRVALGTLEHQLKHHRGRPRHVQWAVASARWGAEQAHLFFSNEAALRAWLTAEGEVGTEGSPCRMTMRWGESLTGSVLAHTPGRDLALSWEETEQSVLVMRTLPHGASRRLLALQWSTWRSVAHRAATARSLTDSLERLARLSERPGHA
jgi:uncharacterized protein YndB with AHSA1/START domain